MDSIDYIGLGECAVGFGRNLKTSQVPPLRYAPVGTTRGAWRFHFCDCDTIRRGWDDKGQQVHDLPDQAGSLKVMTLTFSRHRQVVTKPLRDIHKYYLSL